MKILINTATLKGTGVVQVASSFINECASMTDNKYVVFLSPNVKSNINIETFPNNFKFYEFGKDSLYGIKGRKDKKRMRQIEAEEAPDVVFSVFGPALWKPKAPHILGYAYPHYIYRDSPLFAMLSVKEKLMVKIRELYHLFRLKLEGDFYVCETDDVAARLSKYHQIDINNIYRVYNTASSVFLNYKSHDILREDNEFRFFTLCSPYKHKNMAILNKVIPVLKQKVFNKQIKFYITYPEKDYLNSFNPAVRDWIVNVGPLKVQECPGLVEKCDALFLPTLLECYSASYPEAMCMRKPIITSNLTFAETVCKDAALYFDPMNENSIVECIDKLVSNQSVREMLISKGRDRLLVFGTAHDRAMEYLKICQEVSLRSANK